MFKGDLEGDLKGYLKGDFKVDLEVDLELKFNSFELDSEVGRLVPSRVDLTSVRNSIINIKRPTDRHVQSYRCYRI